MPSERSGRNPLREPGFRTVHARRRRAGAGSRRACATGDRRRWFWWSSLCLFVSNADEVRVVDVERDRWQIEVHGVVGVTAKDPPAGGLLQATEVLVAVGVVADEGAAVALADVLHPALQPFGIEVEHLLA